MERITMEKKRLSFDFTIKSLNRLDAMADTIINGSRVKVLINALRIYEFLIRKYKEGYRVELVKEGKRTKFPEKM